MLLAACDSPSRQLVFLLQIELAGTTATATARRFVHIPVVVGQHHVTLQGGHSEKMARRWRGALLGQALRTPQSHLAFSLKERCDSSIALQHVTTIHNA